MSDAVPVAVLGDLHGHFTLAYRLLRRWEREHGERIPLVLQVGDFGAFPSSLRADAATMRFARRDPDELSFVDYREGRGDAADILDPASASDRRFDGRTFFIKGNHEDFEFLDETGGSGEFPAAVDFHRRMFFMRGGTVHALEAAGRALTVACLGGIADRGGPGRDAVSPHYTAGEVRALLSRPGAVDVLLTHDAPLGAVYAKAGSRDVADLVGTLAPRFHFFGHYHEEGAEVEAPGATRSFQLNEVNFRRSRRLNPGCVGMLRLGGSTGDSFGILDEPWMGEYTRDTFRHL